MHYIKLQPSKGLLLTLLQDTPHLTINTTSSKQITPQVDQEPGQVCCRHCYKTLPHLTINTTSSKKITPQVDQELGQYRSGYDWYSKLIRFEHEHWLLKL